MRWTQQRFRNTESRTGRPWARNLPVTAKRKGHDRALEGESGGLTKQFSYSANSDSVE
ncbi:hypothetical protein ACM25P_13025 [Vreelandella alkaliphila]|uniref:hypothetical protein n=1 Tax=Vreelandella alkaliphila TaxID=272774 RepID=UPI0039F554FA